MSNFILLHRANDSKLVILNVDNINSVSPDGEEGTTNIYNSNEYVMETVVEGVAEIYKMLERFM